MSPKAARHAEEPVALVAPHAAETALTIPDWMKEDAEAQALNPDFDQSEIRLPQLKICQSMTPERKRTEPTFIENLTEGDLFNGASGRIYKAPVKFVMLKFWTNVTRSNADKTGLICRAPGGACQCSQDLAAGRLPKGTVWGTNGEKPPCTKWFNYLLYLIAEQETIWFSAKSTFIKRMMAFHASLRTIHGVPDFAKVFTLESTPTKNGAGQEFYVPMIPRMPVAIVANQALYKVLKDKTIAMADAVVDTSAAETSPDDEPITGEAVGDDKVPF